MSASDSWFLRSEIKHALIKPNEHKQGNTASQRDIRSQEQRVRTL